MSAFIEPARNRRLGIHPFDGISVQLKLGSDMRLAKFLETDREPILVAAALHAQTIPAL